MKKRHPRLANSVLARAEAYREGLLFGATVPQVEEHPLETVEPPQALPVDVAAGVNEQAAVDQARGTSTLDTLTAQSIDATGTA